MLPELSGDAVASFEQWHEPHEAAAIAANLSKHFMAIALMDRYSVWASVGQGVGVMQERSRSMSMAMARMLACKPKAAQIDHPQHQRNR